MKYWRIGTDLTRYLKNWLECLSCFNPGDKLVIKGTSLYSQNNRLVFDGKSSSTLGQNIKVWETFELCKKIECFTILILSTQDKLLGQLINRCKAMIFIQSMEKTHQALKDTIILRILYLEKKIPKDLEVFSQRENKKIDVSLLKRDILAFEKEIYKDKIFVNAIVSKWGEK